MQIDFKGSYSYLTSHTFPGLLAGLEIILFLKLFTPFNGFNILFSIDYKAANFIALLIVIFVLSTLLGLIIDAIHHWGFRKREEKLRTAEIYKYIKNRDQLTIFTKIDIDYWYYYETCANIMIAMVPGIILLPILFLRLGISPLLVLIFIFLYASTLWILYDEARYTLSEILNDVEKNFLENLERIDHPESKEPDNS